MNFKKILITCAMLVTAACAFAKTKIVTTIFPEYDWVKEILGNNIKDAELTLLIGNGVDLHSYQPSIQDVAKISTADIFIYVGGESDGWVADALKNAKNKNMKVINLLEVLGDKVKEEEVIEGMQAEEEEEHEHHHGKEVSTFEDNEVKDRGLSDWEGSWQSPYPLVLDGTLDEAWEEKSEDGKMTAQEYKEYYKTGYKTDIASLTIKGNKITYKYDNGKSVSAKYKYVGYFIQVWSGGTKAAMYRFESMDKKSTAPRFIEINDHMIEPAEAEHFHLRMSNISFDAIEDPEKYWPTFFPASMSGKEIAEHLSGGHHHHDEDEDEEHHHHHHHHSSDEEEVEYDEHVWLSVRNAKILCAEISNALCDVDSKNAAAYKANFNAYAAKLDKLDSDFTAVVKNGKTNTLLFGDRFPFRYFVDDYGLKYYAAFVGCSAETEASFETIIFLANKVDELSLNNVCQIESGNGKIAKTIIQSSKKKNAKILTFDSMQSTTTKDIKKGTSYLSTMQKNLDVLKEALK